MSAPQPALDAAMIDLDGTLVDTVADLTQALDGMLRDLGLPGIEPAFVARTVGGGSEHLVRAVLQRVCGSGPAAQALLPAALDGYAAHYRAVNGRHARVYPGVVDGLQALRSRGLALACVTNKPTPLAIRLLGAKGLDGFFRGVFGGDRFERLKPDPLPLRQTCEALGSAPARTLMVGDSRNDALAARRAGCPVVLVTYGYNHGEPVRGVDADAFVDSLAELANHPLLGVRH